MIDLFQATIPMDDEQLAMTRALFKNLFRGHLEPFLFGSCIGTLIIDRGVSTDQLMNALPHELDTFPWEGCERRVMSILVNKMLQRGQSDDKIRDAASICADVIQDVRQRFFSGGNGVDPIA